VSDRLACDFLLTGAGELVTVASAAPDLGVLTGAALAARDGRIIWIGDESRVTSEVKTDDDTTVVDAGGLAVLPGFVDAHTHAVFAGDRSAEYAARLRGASYLEIMAGGGGIAETVRATRAAPPDELAALARRRFDSFLRHGTTTIETKTGYGLSLEAERACLEAAKVEHPLRRIHTLLSAHAVPPEFAGRADAYVDLVCDEILPALAGEAEFCDVFCDEGAFTVEQARRVLTRAREFGLGLKIHAEQLARTGGAQLAAELGCMSADHLERATADDCRALAATGVTAVLLPGTSYTLRMPYAPARALLDAGVEIALATDFNPGSSYCENLQMAISLACQEGGLTPDEALRAATLGGAAAIGRRADLGSLEVGKACDLIILETESHRELPYHYGVNRVAAVVAGGRVVVHEGAVLGEHHEHDGDECGCGGHTDDTER
jgi:imidazolonepropionase